MNLHRTSGVLIITSLLVAFSFVAFIWGALDKTKNNKPNEIVVVKPIEIAGNNIIVTKEDQQKQSIQSSSSVRKAIKGCEHSISQKESNDGK